MLDLLPTPRSALGLVLGGALLAACTGPAPDRGPDASPPGARLYHVQLQLTDDKERAVEIQTRAQKWWKAQSPAERPPLVEGTKASARAVSIKWKVPYYRVRLGPFATEAQADSVLDAAQSAFPDAFVVPDRRDARVKGNGS